MFREGRNVQNIARKSWKKEWKNKDFSIENINFEDQEVFQRLPDFADWPTFPQVYINGEFIGGCDITLELHEKGELKKMIDEATS